MSNEREMLEFAAKACGYEVEAYCDDGAIVVHNEAKPYGFDWNPKDNSADCFSMCAKLEISTFYGTMFINCYHRSDYVVGVDIEHDGTDIGKEAAWRYAATMVAAKIGGMK